MRASTTRDAILTADGKDIDLIGSFPDATAGRITMLHTQGIVGGLLSGTLPF